MAAMATVNGASTMPTANQKATVTSSIASNLSSSTVQFGASRLPSNGIITTRSARISVVVRAAGDPKRIDNFIDGAKADASQNAKKLGDAVGEKINEAQESVKDVSRDVGAKSQLALDAASRKVDEAGDKAREVGDEVRNAAEDARNDATKKTDQL